MKLRWDIEYRLDSLYNDVEYIENIPTLTDARRMAKKMKKYYGDRLVMLDIKGFDEIELQRHISIY